MGIPSFIRAFVAALAMVLALAASSAHASFPVPKTWQFPSTGFGPAGPVMGSNSEACTWGFNAYFKNANLGMTAGVVANSTVTTCEMQAANGYVGFSYELTTTNACPAGSTLSGGQCTCSAGYEQSGAQCLPANPVCQIGKGHTFNRTEGWARSSSPDADDLVTDNGAPSFYDYNDGACVGNIVSVDKCFRSQVPTAQGLYRTSCDYTMVVTGSAQAAGAADSNPSTPDATCPGFVGEVNGKTVCVGTASSPLPSDKPAPNKPTDAGNPAAGAKPPTGEGSGSGGSGRTPSAGGGGNAGGPAAAAVGRGGTGDRGEDGEDATAVCGAAPLPACAVKVDETGTPDGATFGTGPELGTALDAREAALATARDKAGDAGWGIIPAWTTDTACVPWHIWTLPDFIGGSEVKIDLCPLMPVADGIANFLWVMLGIFAVTGMVGRTITSGGA